MPKVATFTALLFSSVLAGSAWAQAPSEEAYTYFELNCQSCHTIGGGRLAGPDLSGVLERRDRDWLTKFIPGPKAVIDGGDPYGQTLLRDARGVYMPDPPGMTAALAGKLIDLIAHESGLEKSRFAGLQISDRPLTTEDVALGRQLFRGEVDFASGAPACFSCHTVQDAGGFGGGRLGPDLSAVFGRLEGRKALSAWLSAPPSAVMAPVYRITPLDSDEVLALTAYLKHSAESGVEEARSGVPAFLLVGCALAALILVGFDIAWRNRYSATRRPLVEGARLKNLVEGRSR